jgi:UDP-N-acetylmuramate: L-alanyl-gamma-D-glutamyl-meso-diaminopimelate ligase
VVLPPVGRAGLKEEEKLDVQRLCTELGARLVEGKPLESVYLPNVAAIVSYLQALVEPGDTIAILSNGAFGGIHRKLLTALGASPGDV